MALAALYLQSLFGINAAIDGNNTVHGGAIYCPIKVNLLLPHGG
jgi:predicted outer membrane repeat protein